MATLEKLVWVLAVITVFGVVGLIGLHSVGVRFGSSHISQADVHYDQIAANAGNEAIRIDESGVSFVLPTVGSRRVAPTARPATAQSRSSSGSKPRSNKRNERSQPGRDEPDDSGPFEEETGPDPFAPNQPGGGRGPGGGGANSGYTATVHLPPSFVEKYRSFQDAYDALTSVTSADVPYNGQTAIELGFVPPDHPLKQNLGLEAGDVVVSVNGYAPSRQNGMDLYNKLKDESVFTVKIDRGGTVFTAVYKAN